MSRHLATIPAVLNSSQQLQQYWAVYIDLIFLIYSQRALKVFIHYSPSSSNKYQKTSDIVASEIQISVSNSII
jgi:hypothetical protein